MQRTEKYERGIYPGPGGHFKARISRNGRQHTETFPTIEEAREFRDSMESILGPPQWRQKQHEDWAAEFERQKAALPPGTNLTSIYFRKTGIHVSITRQGVLHYVGHFHDLKTAIAARNRAHDKLSLPVRPGRTKTRVS
jgi:hypothetical protein